MSYINPAPVANPNAIGFEQVCNDLQTVLGLLSWNQKSFGRAFEQPEASGERRVPFLYAEDGEYYNALPNDNLNSYSFLMSRSGERVVYDSNLERDMTAIFWFDLSQIRPNEDKVGISGLIRDAYNAIKETQWIVEFTTIYDERHEDIFLGYIDRDMLKENKYLMFPFAGFRIDFVVGYPNPC